MGNSLAYKFSFGLCHSYASVPPTRAPLRFARSLLNPCMRRTFAIYPKACVDSTLFLPVWSEASNASLTRGRRIIQVCLKAREIAGCQENHDHLQSSTRAGPPVLFFLFSFCLFILDKFPHLCKRVYPSIHQSFMKYVFYQCIGYFLKWFHLLPGDF